MKKTVTTIAMVLIAAITVRADVLALWENDDVAGADLTAAVDTVHADLSSSVLSQAIGSAANWNDTLGAIHNAAAVNTLAAAITANDYFSFTVTPDAGKSVNYSDLFLRYSVAANVQPATTVFTLMSDVTGFTALDGIDTVSATHSSGTSIVGTDTFDISGVAALQNVASSVEFRLYVHNASGNMTRVAIGHLFYGNGTDDLVLNGTVIPEPATMGLFGFASAGLLWWRKRFAA